jgi:hypothetical protein
MAKKTTTKTTKTLAEREAYHKKKLENIEVRKQIDILRKRLKS